MKTKEKDSSLVKSYIKYYYDNFDIDNESMNTIVTRLKKLKYFNIIINFFSLFSFPKVINLFNFVSKLE